MNSLQEIAQVIKNKDNYILVGHAIPDGDCIGSLIGLYWGLLSIGKEVRILLQDFVPETYSYLYGSDKFLGPEQLSIDKENIIFLDCSDFARVGDRVGKILEKRTFSINIDHHLSNEMYADFNYVDCHAAATAEIVFQLLKQLDIDITFDIASAIYAGIVQDTGGFKHSSTTSNTFRTAADLLELGVNLEQTKINLFESKSREELLLLSLALQHINFSDDGKIAWMTLAYESVKAIDAVDIHPEGIINHTLLVKGVEVGLLFREISPGIVKIGFRSKTSIDVSQLAALYGGGGHRQAAGASQKGDLEEITHQVISSIRDVIN